MMIPENPVPSRRRHEPGSTEPAAPRETTDMPDRDVADETVVVPETSETGAHDDPDALQPLGREGTTVEEEADIRVDGDDAEAQADGVPDDDEIVDVASEDSMDASDPPSFTPTTGPATQAAPPADGAQPPRRSIESRRSSRSSK